MIPLQQKQNTEQCNNDAESNLNFLIQALRHATFKFKKMSTIIAMMIIINTMF